MLIALLFVVAVLCSGYAVLRPLRIAKGAVALGLVAPAGLAVGALGATWVALLGAPTPVAGALVLVVSLVGVCLLVIDRDALWSSTAAFARQHRMAATLLAVAVVVPIVSMGVAFMGVQAPLSPHDGAFHVESSQAVRQATVAATWYPPGLAALFGAWLQLLPWVDTAQGTYDLGLGLTLLAAFAVFGLGSATLGNLAAASAAALFNSLTYLLAYYPQMWSGWPQLFGILLVLGLWIVAVQYLENPSWPAAVLAGILVGATIVVHGTELYTSAIVLLVLALANWRRIAWRQLGLHLIETGVLAVLVAVPYLPVLLHWAGGGGAFAVGFEDGSALDTGSKNASAAEALGAFTLDALGVDVPVRIVLIVLGAVWAIRQRSGRVVIALAAVFCALAVVSSFLNGLPLVRQVYAATYPWSLPYRHLTFAVIPLALIAGNGSVVLRQFWGRLLGRVHGVAAHRRIQRTGRLLIVTWLLLATAGLIIFLSIPRQVLASFSDDDAAAMAWLLANAHPAEVLANDGFADAGIWAPYKAGVPILVYRSVSDPTTAAARALVLANIARLDQSPEAAAAACAVHVVWVYYGALTSGWDVRRYPPLEELRASPALSEAYSQGDAVVFRTRLACPLAGD